MQQSNAPNAPSQSRTDLREAEGMMMGLVGQRRQLVSEVERLQERKVELVDRLTSASREQASAYRQTMAEIDQQLSGARTALKAIDATIAAHQGVPAAPPAPTAPPAPEFAYVTEQHVPVGFPESSPLPLYLSAGALTLVALTIAVGMAYARRLRRETAAAIERFHLDLRTELQRLTHGVDAMSVELERIGEGQRFVTKALVEKKETV